MKCQTWCGACYEGLKGRATRRGHCGWRPLRRTYAMSLQRPAERVGSAGVGSGGQASAEEGAFGSTFPLLFEHLTAAAWADGSTRETSSLTVFVEEGRWKACFNERALNKVCFVSGRSFMDLLSCLEAGLQEDDLDWRSKRPDRRR
jgi:hypothetical protein